MVAIRTATGADRRQLSEAFASAFSEDPLFAWMCGPRAPLEARMRVFFDALVKSNLRRPEHLVLFADDGTAGAIWRPVDRWKVPPTDFMRGLLGIARAFRNRLPTMLG